MTRQALKVAMLAAAMNVAAAGHAARAADSEARCERKVVAKGFPNKVETVAGLSAVRLWVEAVKAKHGADYSMWHNAKAPALRCNLAQDDAEYITCVAIGLPCQMRIAATEDAEEKAAKHRSPASPLVRRAR